MIANLFNSLGRLLIGLAALLVTAIVTAMTPLILKEFNIDYSQSPVIVRLIVDLFSFVSSPWFWGLTGLVFGLIFRPYLDGFFAKEDADPAKNLSMLRVQIRNRQRTIKAYLSLVWRNTRRPLGLPALPVDDRAQVSALFDKFEARGLAIPALGDLTDYEFAIVTYRYFAEVTPSFSDETVDVAKRKAKKFSVRVTDKEQIKTMGEELQAEYRANQRPW